MVAEGKNHPVSEMLIEGDENTAALHGLVQYRVIFSFLHIESTYTENIMSFGLQWGDDVFIEHLVEEQVHAGTSSSSVCSMVALQYLNTAII